jgi:quinol monooxygenase YgiN
LLAPPPDYDAAHKKQTKSWGRTMRLFVGIALAMMGLVPGTARAQTPDQTDPTVYIVSYIDAAFTAKNEVAGLLRQLAEASRKEPGNLRFEALQRTTPSNQFMLLEVWKDQQAADAHAAAAPSKTFRDKLNAHLLSPVDDRPCIATHVAALPPPAPRGAVFVVTHVDVPGNVRDKAVPMLKTLAEATRKEAGNLRFDVVHQKGRTNHFTVMEIWKDQKSHDTHELAAPAREFRAQLTPITGALYDQRWYKAL